MRKLPAPLCCCPGAPWRVGWGLTAQLPAGHWTTQMPPPQAVSEKPALGLQLLASPGGGGVPAGPFLPVLARDRPGGATTSSLKLRLRCGATWVHGTEARLPAGAGARPGVNLWVSLCLGRGHFIKCLIPAQGGGGWGLCTLTRPPAHQSKERTLTRPPAHQSKEPRARPP